MLLREARSRLNADLQRVYGLCLTDMYEERASVLDVADFAVNLPRGGAVSEWFGGWGSITAEEEALRRVEFTLVAVNSGKKKPPLPSAPQGLRDIELGRKAKAHRQAQRDEALASMHAALQARSKEAPDGT